MFALAQALPGRVVVTTTTRIFAAQIKLAAAACNPENLEGLSLILDRHHFCLVVGEVVGDKAFGVDPALPGELLARPDVDFVLVEADGSRMRPVKAPADHEPVVPPQTTLLVPVVGIDALDKPISAVAHRPELVARLLAGPTGAASVDQKLTAEAIATLIAHPRGGLKGAPRTARLIPYINKVERDDQLAGAHQIARSLLHETRIEQVVIGAIRGGRAVRAVHKRVTAVVLAAGQAKRMGQAKQLLPWHDITVLGQTLRNLKSSAVHDVVVVTGYEAGAVEGVARAEGIRTIYNPSYQSGEMLSSLKKAVEDLPKDREAVLVMLADQPMIEPATIDLLLGAYWQGSGELIAPVYAGTRGNPVLIGRSHFSEFLALPPDSAPRVLLERHRASLHLVPVQTDSILRDLDLPEDYQRWHRP
jgi:molybdenum cofactor cytidylyltransferase